MADKSTNDRLHDATALLMECRWRLGHLARALDTAGNEKVAERLEDIASNISEATDEVRRAWSEEVSARCRQSQEATANMIEGMLAVASVAK